jgi:hypothetical protein
MHDAAASSIYSLTNYTTVALCTNPAGVNVLSRL